MRKIVKMVSVAAVFVVILTIGLSSAALANEYVGTIGSQEYNGPGPLVQEVPGPAPNSGDGIHDSSGW